MTDDHKRWSFGIGICFKDYIHHQLDQDSKRKQNALEMDRMSPSPPHPVAQEPPASQGGSGEFAFTIDDESSGSDCSDDGVNTIDTDSDVSVDNDTPIVPDWRLRSVDESCEDMKRMIRKGLAASKISKEKQKDVLIGQSPRGHFLYEEFRSRAKQAEAA
jgi:hypothetical protein